jgi:hypothetical protein
VFNVFLRSSNWSNPLPQREYWRYWRYWRRWRMHADIYCRKRGYMLSHRGEDRRLRCSAARIESGDQQRLHKYVSLSLFHVNLCSMFSLDLQIGQILCLSGSAGGGGGGCAQTYTVVGGDTCSAIESRTGVSDAQLHALNPAINSGCTSTFPSHFFL